MVKKKKPKAIGKPKEFAANPFAALKRVQAEEVKPPEPPGKEEKPAPPPGPAAGERDDLDLFLRAMADVKKLDGTFLSARVRKRSAEKRPLPVVVAEEESRLFLEAMKGIEVRFTEEPAGAEKERKASPARMRQLKRGTIRIDFELDLHGLTRDEALESLERFVAGAFRRGQQAVLVITGKGNNSPGEPVLQGAVASWLRERGKGMVAEFAPAPREMGGSGAFVVFLRSKVVKLKSEQ